MRRSYTYARAELGRGVAGQDKQEESEHELGEAHEGRPHGHGREMRAILAVAGPAGVEVLVEVNHV